MSQRNTIILCSALSAFSILGGLYKLGAIKNPTYIAMAVFTSIGLYLLYGAFSGLRRGEVWVSPRRSIVFYNRRRDPFRFWFYILLFTLSGLVALGVAVYGLLHPNLHR